MIMFLLVTYQIHDQKLRRRIISTLKNFGTEIQRSVFEFHLNAFHTEQLITALKSYSSALKKEDSLRIYKICRRCVERVEIISGKPLARDPLYYLV